MSGERPKGTFLNVVRFEQERDFADPKKLGLFWSDVNDKVKSRMGFDNHLYTGNGIPVPENFDNRCWDCGGIMTENRSSQNTCNDKVIVSLSRDCRGSCGQSFSLGSIEISKDLVRQSVLFVKIPQGVSCGTNVLPINPPEKTPKVIFGEVPKEEAKFRHRQEQKVQKKRESEMTPEPTPYDHMRKLPMIKEAIIWNYRKRIEERKERKREQLEFAKKFWGPNVQFKPYMSPSVVCDCIRQAGKDAVAELAGRPTIEPTVEVMNILNMGSDIHYGFLRRMNNYLPGDQETKYKSEEPALSGRIDFILDDPISGDNSILELKTEGNWPFGKLNPTDLPARLKNTPDIVNEEAGHRKQVLLYLWSLSQKGRKVESGSLIYLDRNSGELKEAIVPWDEGAQEEVGEFIHKLTEAEIKIEQTLDYIRNTDPDKIDWEKVEDMLPPATVVDKSKCKNRCPHRFGCRPGLKYAVEGIKHPKRKLSAYARKKIKEREAEKKEELKKSTIWQGNLL